MTLYYGPRIEPYYKVLSEDGAAHHGGRGRWSLPNGKPAEWMPPIPDIEPCARGYHVCVGSQDLIHWLGPAIYTVEVRGESIRHENKTVVSEARLIERCDHWNERTARLFAAACARDVLHLYEERYPNDGRPRKAIEAAEKFARGEVDRIYLDAADSAAYSAAYSAADSAAYSAAYSAAAYSAANSAAAYSAAYSAADSAAYSAAYSAAADSAAYSAADSAARTKQARRLAHLLRTGEVVQEFAP